MPEIKGLRTFYFNTAGAIKGAGINVRQRIVSIIENSIPKQHAALLNGMLIGYTEGFTDNEIDAFRDSGLVHIMAVSGANIAFLLMPLVFILKRLKIRTYLSDSICIIVVIGFVFITGFDASVVRAALMASILLICNMFGRDADIYTSIAFAGLLMLLNNTYVIYDVGFQLSFAATLGIVMFYKNIERVLPKKLPKIINDTVAGTISAQIAIIPISMYHFNTFPVISLISNLLVVPITEIITVTGLIMAIGGFFTLLIPKIVGYLNCSMLSAILFVTNISSNTEIIYNDIIVC